MASTTTHPSTRRSGFTTDRPRGLAIAGCPDDDTGIAAHAEPNPPPPSPSPEGDVSVGAYVFKIADRLGAGRRLIRGEVKHYGGTRQITARIVEAKELPDFLGREGAVLHLLHNHPQSGIPQMRATVEAPGGRSFIVMDGLDSTLDDAVRHRGRLSEFEARAVIKQLTTTVAHCHKHRIVLRDLRLDKACVVDCSQTNMSVVLADMEGAHTVTTAGPLLVRGQPSEYNLRDPNRVAYVAPESLANRPFDGAAADSWALGVMLYVMLTGVLPFQDARRDIYEKLQRASADLRFPSHVSCGARGLVCQLLDKDPRMRPTAAAVLEDAWVRRSADDAYAAEGPVAMGVPSAPGSRRSSMSVEETESAEPEQVVPSTVPPPRTAKRSRQRGAAKRKSRPAADELGPALRRRLSYLSSSRADMLIITPAIDHS